MWRDQGALARCGRGGVVRAAGAPRERVHGAYLPVGWGGWTSLLTGGEKALLVDVWAVSRNTGSRVWSGIT